MSTNSSFSLWLGRAVLLAWCLAPSLWSLRVVAGTPAPPAAIPAVNQNALAMHIHMVHLQEFDLREGKAVARFEFHNASSNRLKVLNIKPSCGCVTTRFRQQETGFDPGQAGEFYLEVDTSAERSGSLEYQVKIQFAELGEDLNPVETGEEEVIFRVEVPEKKVTVSPRALIFYQLGSEPTTQEITITDFREGKQLVLEAPTVTSEFLSVQDVQPGKDDNGNPRWTFKVTAAAQVPSGNHNGLVRLNTNDSDFPILRVPILIYGAPEKTGEVSAVPAAPKILSEKKN